MIRLYAVDVSALSNPVLYEKCYLRSDRKRREKADSFKNSEDKGRCIAAGLLLAYAYEKFRSEYIKELARANSFDYALQMPEVIAGENGKPEFRGKDGEVFPIRFNLSHSGDMVVCVMADFEVGADVQKSTDVRENLVRRVFSEQEKQRLEECGEDAVLREVEFARIWSLREAKAKLTGRGMGQMLEERCMDSRSQEYCLWNGMLGKEYAWTVVAFAEDCMDKDDAGICGLHPYVVNEGELFYEKSI